MPICCCFSGWLPIRFTQPARAGHAVHFRSASPLEALALESLRAGTRFGALCERLAQRGAEPQSLLGLLERWVDDGLLRAPSRLPV